jgi:hypothetical protein
VAGFDRWRGSTRDGVRPVARFDPWRGSTGGAASAMRGFGHGAAAPAAVELWQAFSRGGAAKRECGKVGNSRRNAAHPSRKQSRPPRKPFGEPTNRKPGRRTDSEQQSETGSGKVVRAFGSGGGAEGSDGPGRCDPLNRLVAVRKCALRVGCRWLRRRWVDRLGGRLWCPTRTVGPPIGLGSHQISSPVWAVHILEKRIGRLPDACNGSKHPIYCGRRTGGPGSA